MGLPLAIYFLSYFFRKDLKDKFYLCAGALTSIAALFLPFIMARPDMWFEFPYNSWTLQTQMGNPLALVAAIIFIIAFSFSWKEYGRYLEYMSVAIFVFVSIPFFKLIINYGFFDVIELDIFDISYLNVSLPFVLLSLSNKTKKDIN